MMAMHRIVGMAAAALVMAGCENRPELSSVAKRLAMEDVLGTIGPAILLSEYTGETCASHDYDRRLANADIVGAGRRLFREGYTEQEVQAGTDEVMAVVRARVQKDIDAGRYAPADAYCQRLESTEVQQDLLGFRYLRKAS